MKTGIAAAAFFATGILVAASASATTPTRTTNAAPPPTDSGTEIADAGHTGLRGSHDGLDDGRQTPRLATGGPRRLSALAGSDDQAWTSARSISPVTWRKAARKPQPH